MINKIPFIGWMLSLIGSASMAIPFWVCWTLCGIGAKYFYWLPSVYHDAPFWDCVGVFMCAGIIKAAIIPTLASVSQSNTNNKQEDSKCK